MLEKLRAATDIGRRDVFEDGCCGRRLRSVAVLVALCGILALVAAGCGGSEESPAAQETSGAEESAAAEEINVGLALLGPKNDRSYNQSVYEGALRAEQELAVNLTVVENVDDPSREADVVRNLGRTNDLVIPASVTLATATERIAPDFPNTQFVVVGGRAETASNVHFADIAPRAGGYLVGVVAANLSETKTIGFIGGAEIPPTTETQKGFELGAKSADPSIDVRSIIVGSFADPVKAKQAAASQIAAGVDVIFGWLDAGYPGVLQAIRESGKDVKAFSVAVSKCDLGNEHVGDHILGYKDATFNLIRDFVERRQLQPVLYGLEDANVQRLELCPSYDRADLRALVDETTRAIVSGEINLDSG